MRQAFHPTEFKRNLFFPDLQTSSAFIYCIDLFISHCTLRYQRPLTLFPNMLHQSSATKLHTIPQIAQVIQIF